MKHRCELKISFAPGLHICIAVARPPCVSWAFLLLSTSIKLFRIRPKIKMGLFKQFFIIGLKVTHVESDEQTVECPAGDPDATFYRHAGARVQRDVTRQCAHAQWRLFYFRLLFEVVATTHARPSER